MSTVLPCTRAGHGCCYSRPCCCLPAFISYGTWVPPDGRRTDAELFAFERTSQLVTSGIFRLIRHPLYASLLLLAWGVACKQPNGLSLLRALLASLALWLTAKRDGAECLQQFGDAYGNYMQRSKMFIPWVI